ncbi:acyltransferase family protein [Streptomyces buecherae]|uniref:acyltransferase family protein n=1 Tax=Streptomyces buecherae TaxID=2763006 RepID=UPI0036BEC29B
MTAAPPPTDLSARIPAPRREKAARGADAARAEAAAAPARAGATEIQSFRGIAALSTVLFHVWQQYHTYDARGSHPPLDNRFLGALISLEVIDFFFVLSAYLLTLSYARAAIDQGSVRPARLFLFRRAIRIVPLYFLAVLVVWASRNPSLPGDWRDLVEHLTFTHVFDGDRIFYTLGPTWSLSLEIVFYLTLVAIGPLAVRACGRIGTRGGRAALCAAGCAVLFAVPLVWLAVARYAWGVPHTDWAAYFGPQARFGGFAAGMGLAVLMVALDGRGKLPGWCSAALSAASAVGLFALSLYSAPENLVFTFYHPIASLLWVVLLYSTLQAARRVRWHRVLHTRWLTGTGLVSYSLFIWHEPIMLQSHKVGLLPQGPEGFPLALLIVLAVSIPVAVASYWFIEYPSSLLGRLKDSSGKPRDFYPEVAR